MTIQLPDPARSQAVLIGVGTYTDGSGFTNIPAIVNNIADLRSVLQDRLRFGLPFANIKTIVDLGDHGAIGHALRTASEDATDTLIVYYAGHGLTSPDGQLVLTSAQTTRATVPFTSFGYDLVRAELRRARARRKVVILDCCFSGRAVGVMSDAPHVGIDGAFVLASSGATRASLAPPGERNTAFTAAMLQILRDGVPGGPHTLTLQDLFLYTRQLLLTRSHPDPQCVATNGVDGLAFVVNAADIKSDQAHPRTLPDLKQSRIVGSGKARHRSVWFAVAAALTALLTFGTVMYAGRSARHLANRPNPTRSSSQAAPSLSPTPTNSAIAHKAPAPTPSRPIDSPPTGRVRLPRNGLPVENADFSQTTCSNPCRVTDKDTGPPRSAAARWTSNLGGGTGYVESKIVPSSRQAGRTMMQVCNGGNGFILQNLATGGARYPHANVWALVYLISGSTLQIGAGPLGNPGIDASTTTAGQWVLLQAPTHDTTLDIFVIQASGPTDTCMYVADAGIDVDPV